MFRFYDDELHNLILVANKSIKEIIAYLSVYDYHPPFQYLVNKLFLQLFGLDELWLKIPSILFMASSIVICSMLVYRLTGSVKAGLVCGIVSIINPLILLWGTSLRWYPLWTFLAMLSLYTTIILFTSSNKSKRIRSQLLLAIIIVLALYTNYQTIILILTILLSAFILDLKEKVKRYDHLKSILPVIIAVIILFIPYLNTFLHHTGSYMMQKQMHSGFTGSSPLLTSGYFIYSVLFGNSLYPWEISFIIPFCIIICALLMFLWKLSIQSINMLKALAEQEKKKQFLLIILFTVILFLLFLGMSVISDSLQTRGYLILPLLLVTIFVICINLFRKAKNRKLFSLSLIVSGFLVIWLIGSYNVITRKSLHKASLMDPIEEVLDYVQDFTLIPEKNYFVFTYDPVFTYYLIQQESLNDKLIVFSPYKEETFALINSFSKLKDNRPNYLSPNTKILFIDSYPGSLMPVTGKLNHFKQYLVNNGIQNEMTRKFGFDANADIKRKYFPSAGIVNWRYMMHSIVPKNSMDLHVLKSFDSLKVN